MLIIFCDLYLLMRNFNIILKCNEKKSGLSYIDSKMVLFRNFVNHLKLIDLSFVGSIMTWNNHKNGPNNIQEMIDRILVSHYWFTNYPDAQVLHLENIGWITDQFS